MTIGGVTILQRDINYNKISFIADAYTIRATCKFKSNQVTSFLL